MTRAAAAAALRLVKGDGEIVEEIVSRERQKAINKVCKWGV